LPALLVVLLLALEGEAVQALPVPSTTITNPTQIVFLLLKSPMIF
jgi:hypothetical protein